MVAKRQRPCWVFGSRLAQQYEERFQIPLGMALIILIAEAFLSDCTKGKKRQLEIGIPAPKK